MTRGEAIALPHRIAAHGHPALPSEETEEMLPEKVKYIWTFPKTKVFSSLSTVMFGYLICSAFERGSWSLLAL